jgi:hypothetical protein
MRYGGGGSGHGLGGWKQRFKARLEVRVFGLENVAKLFAVTVTNKNGHDGPLLKGRIINCDSQYLTVQIVKT